MKICGEGGGRGEREEPGVTEEDDIEGTRRLGRGRIGRVLMKDEGRCEEFEGEEYCWGGR